MSKLLLADSQTLSQVQSQSSTKNSRKSHFHARNDSSEELRDMAGNISGESEVSVSASWHGTPRMLPVTVADKTASQSCHESLCPSYNEGPLCTAEKFGVVNRKKTLNCLLTVLMVPAFPSQGTRSYISWVFWSLFNVIWSLHY